jgi:hypothetical protein
VLSAPALQAPVTLSDTVDGLATAISATQSGWPLLWLSRHGLSDRFITIASDRRVSSSSRHCQHSSASRDRPYPEVDHHVQGTRCPVAIRSRMHLVTFKPIMASVNETLKRS